MTNSLAKTIYLAHLDPEGKRAPQLLLDHLRQVSRLAEEFAPTPEMKAAARQCGLLHDVGVKAGL